MPHIIVTEGAARGLEQCRLFLVGKAPEAARRAADAISSHFVALETTPDIGRPVPDVPGLRELIIPFGESGYVALYRFEPATDYVFILAFQHQRKAGYHS